MNTLGMPSNSSKIRNKNKLLDRFYKLIYQNPLYSYTLVGRTPKRLLGTPPELIQGNAASGQLILAGSLLVARERWPLVDITHIPENTSSDWQAYLHSFKWLSDLRAVGNNRARNIARTHISDWLNTYTKWSPMAWQADILGQRLTNFIIHFGFFAREAPQEFHDLFFLEIMKQARHLNRSIVKSISGPGRIRGLQGLIYCGISLPNNENYKLNGLRLLEIELDHQLYRDGCHYSRNPQTHLQVLTDLIAIRDTLTAAHFDIPNWLNNTIKNMVPILRTFRHSDGGLAFFNGSSDSNSKNITAILTKSGVKSRAISSAPHSGFQRLYSGKTNVLIDTGSPPLEAANKWGHSGTLGFEMSSGKDRIIVNCGMPTNASIEWRQALRSTAAHSTIVVGNNNSSEIDLTGGFSNKPSQVTTSRREIDGSTIIEASFDGYLKIFGLTHRRLIMLAPDGSEIQGEDNLIGSGRHQYNLRFHLHPNIQATILQDKCSAILKPRSGTGWRFTCTDHVISLEESIYFDGVLPHRRTLQILASGSSSNYGATIKWRLSRI
jgi:uncharacterized heparinase superfamily protein